MLRPFSLARGANGAAVDGTASTVTDAHGTVDDRQVHAALESAAVDDWQPTVIVVAVR
jgi:hypothetical protein